MKLLKPELYLISQVVLALPVTQVSVKRSFSGLTLIVSPCRTNLCSAVLEDILVVRANAQFNKPSKVHILNPAITIE